MVPTVKMPRADWESLLLILEVSKPIGIAPVIIDILHKEIEDQVYAQEY